MADIYGRPFEPLADLIDRHPLEEMKFQSAPLFVAESFHRALQERSPVTEFCFLRPTLIPQIFHRGNRFTLIVSVIEIAPSEVPSPVQRAMVTHPRKPGTSCSLRRIEKGAFVQYKEEDVMDKILGFSSISQNPFPHRENGSRIPKEKEAQRLPISRLHSQEQGLIIYR